MLTRRHQSRWPTRFGEIAPHFESVCVSLLTFCTPLGIWRTLSDRVPSTRSAGDIAWLKPPSTAERTGDKIHDDVIIWKHFPRYWPFVPFCSSHKGQWRGAFMFSLICAWINRWVNNREAGDLRRYRAHHDVIVMYINLSIFKSQRSVN